MDTVTIAATEYSVPEGSGQANITLVRTGDMLDDIMIPFRAHALPDAANPAIRELHVCGSSIASVYRVSHAQLTRISWKSKWM